MITMKMTMLLGMEQALSSFLLDKKVNIECFSGLLFDIASSMSTLFYGRVSLLGIISYRVLSYRGYN